jgi:hypothetical protein
MDLEFLRQTWSVLTRMSEHEPGNHPRWAVPVALCIAALLIAIGVRFRIEGEIADAAARAGDVAAQNGGVAAGPGIDNPDGDTNTTGATGQRIAADLTIDRDAESRGEISSLDDGELWVNPESSGLPWSALGAVDGLLTFRGNPTRTYHGQGPVPTDPEVLWSTNIGCSNSPVGGQPKQWCGTGWTGQPSVFRQPRTGTGQSASSWWVGIGGYNRSVNFFDATTGEETYPRFQTGDIIKGSITVDPDGFPLIYSGSRDNFFHIASIDGDEPEELWRLSSASEDPTLWNNDWDSSAVIVDGYLLVGGENSRFYIVELNRGYDRLGNVTVDPEVVFSAAGWDQELLADVGDQQVSIENSIAVSGQTAYFTNSGGLVQGWDLGPLREGSFPERVFRYWTGDDTDASIVIDDDGMLYVASEYERGNGRARELGQVFKLDPLRPDDPLVWSQDAADRLGGGVWATPAIHQDLLLVATDDGRVLGLDRADGVLRWTIDLVGPLWSSPVVVDEVLIQGDCDGTLHGFDLSNTDREPQRLWSVTLDGCIESTPAVWDGRIFVGTRSGQFYGIGDGSSGSITLAE